MKEPMKDEILDLNCFCISCMQSKSLHSVCPTCGYNERQYTPHPLYLKPHILLQNQYIIGKALGQGGFGITYIGFDKWLQKKVAIKEFLPSALATRDFQTTHIVPLKKQESAFHQGLQLFIDEARNLAKFDHPNIVRVINFFEENQTAYMVMEHLEGENLAELLSRLGCCLTVEEALIIIFPILDALVEVHAQQIYHRDISPQNIRLLPTGIPILIDFGAARHVVGENSRSLDLVLKHGYSPLEQYSGKGKIGSWTDIYACGALLYLLISGKLPPAATDRFCDDTLIPLIEQPNIAISETASTAIFTALAVKLEERFQTVQDFKAALEGRQSVTVLISNRRTQTASYPIKMTLLAIITTLTLAMTMLIYFIKPPILPLLEKAKGQWLNQQITTPIGNNVYETYQQILAIDSYNHDAKQGINRIIHYYIQQAKQAEQIGDFTKGLQWVTQGLQLNKSHNELQELQHTLQTQQIQQQLYNSQINQLIEQATQYFQIGQLEATYHTYQQILSLEPNNLLVINALQQLETQYTQQINTQSSDISKQTNLLNQALLLFPTSQQLLDLKKQLLTTKLPLSPPAAPTAQDNIKKLLEKAEQQIAVLHLTEPTGDSAYETYQQILALAPNHAQAQKGLVKIADLYEKLARSESASLEKSLALIEKGLKILPNHVNLLALQKKMLTQSSRVTTQPPIETVPVIAKPVEQASDKIAKLLTTAAQQLKEAQFEPAYYLYQNVLQWDGKNQSALSGLRQIAQHYEQLAKQQQEARDFIASLSTITKGLMLYPENSNLLKLQQEINASLVIKTMPNRESETITLPQKTDSQNILFTPSF